MPTYDYRCENCEYEFERFQSITAKPLRKCPKCGKRGLKRLIGTGAGVIFKGTGFYQTDYRSESYKKSEKSEKGEKGTGDKKTDEKKTDTTTKSTGKCTKSGQKAEPGAKSEKKPM